MNRKICVYAICKNESKFIDKWLDNMSEADYIVVLDTGSTDGSYKKLKEDKRVTRVEKKIIKPWRFDVARNESMKLIPDDADILVCTDFDELFEPGWATVLRDAWQDDTNRILYTYAWSHNEVGEPQDVFTYDKIHDRNYEWIFPVHEVLAPKNPNFIQNRVDVGDAIYLHHYQDKEKSRSSYLDLLKLSMEEHPDDSHVRMLYARELFIVGTKEESLNEFLEVLKMPDIDSPNKRSVLLNSLLQVALIYEELKNYDEVIWYCQEFIKEDHTYREPYILLAEVYNEMNMPTLAEGMIEAAKKYSYQHHSWIERASTFTNWLEDAESITQYKLGNYKEACELGAKALSHEPNDSRLLKNQICFYEAYIKELESKNYGK